MAMKGQGVAIAVGIGLGVGGLMLMGSRGRARGGQATVNAACGDSPQRAAGYRSDRGLRFWVGCRGRTATQVAQLASHLESRGRAREADLVRSTWNARRAVEDAPADGQVSPETRATAEAALTGPPPTSVPDEPTEAPQASAESTSEAGSARARFDPADSRTYDPARARVEARTLYRYLRQHRSGRLDPERLIPFQEAAGLATDGVYGGMTYNALRYYGITNPPRPRVAPDPDDPSAAYVPSSASSVFRDA